MRCGSCHSQRKGSPPELIPWLRSDCPNVYGAPHPSHRLSRVADTPGLFCKRCGALGCVDLRSLASGCPGMPAPADRELLGKLLRGAVPDGLRDDDQTLSFGGPVEGPSA